ncbi:hypothetical protein cypCar_00048466 [Cyprinus carpio]|nr:hypothetical protein cypCar_00048466 [Cyprinus carpio]
MKEHQQNISTCLGLVGLLIIARSIRLTTENDPFFKSFKSPAALYCLVDIAFKREMTTHTGFSRSACDSSGCASGWSGADLRRAGLDWSTAEMVWLRLIARQNETLHCLVSVNRAGAIDQISTGSDATMKVVSLTNEML